MKPLTIKQLKLLLRYLIQQLETYEEYGLIVDDERERIEQRKEKITKLNAEKAKEQERLQQDKAVLKRKKELTA